MPEHYIEAFNAVVNLITASLLAWVLREQKASSRERERRHQEEANGQR